MTTSFCPWKSKERQLSVVLKQEESRLSFHFVANFECELLMDNNIFGEPFFFFFVFVFVIVISMLLFCKPIRIHK